MTPRRDRTRVTRLGVRPCIEGVRRKPATLVLHTDWSRMNTPALFHFTALGHLPTIVDAGFLKLTESNASRLRTHAAPPVVWLTTTPIAGTKHGLNAGVNEPGTAADKTRVRFEVDVPDAEPWLGSELYHQTEPAWRRTLISTGGGMAAARTWWMAPSVIPAERWISLEVDGERC